MALKTEEQQIADTQTLDDFLRAIEYQAGETGHSREYRTLLKDFYCAVEHVRKDVELRGHGQDLLRDTARAAFQCAEITETIEMPFSHRWSIVERAEEIERRKKFLELRAFVDCYVNNY